MVNAKRAVSPLIAAILLIALTVSIGAMIIGWGRQYVQQQTSCLGVGFQIIDIAYDNPTNPTKIQNITIFNTGSVQINSGDRILFIAEDSTGQRSRATVVVNSNIPPGNTSNIVNVNLDISNLWNNKPIKLWGVLARCPNNPSEVYLII